MSSKYKFSNYTHILFVVKVHVFKLLVDRSNNPTTVVKYPQFFFGVCVVTIRF